MIPGIRPAPTEARRLCDRLTYALACPPLAVAAVVNSTLSFPIGGRSDYEWPAAGPITSVVAPRSGQSGCLGQACCPWHHPATAGGPQRRRRADRPQSRPRRWAIAAASTRPAARSLARMLETWTLAVLGLMNSA